MAVKFLRRAWRGQKPSINSEINWQIAPPSLVLAMPMNTQGGQPFEYVTRLVSSNSVFTGALSWTPAGLKYEGGGVVTNGSEIKPPVEVPPYNHRRTVAWRQRNLMHLHYLGSQQAYPFAGGTGDTRFAIQAPDRHSRDPKVGAWTMSDSIEGDARSTLLGVWHTLMVSFSTGLLGAEPRAGWRVWDDGTKIAGKDTFTGTKHPANVTININTLLAGINGWAGEIEYWYEFDRYTPDDDLAGQLHENPYWFFRAPLYRTYSFPPPPSVTLDPGLGASDTCLLYDLSVKGWSVWPGMQMASLWIVQDPDTGHEEVFAGGRDGSVRVLNRPEALTSYEGTAAHTSALGVQGLQKSPRHLFLYFREEGAYTVAVATTFDFSGAGQTQNVSLLGTGTKTLGVNWVLGVDPLGRVGQIGKRLNLRGIGEFLTVKISNSVAGQQFTWIGYEVHWRPRRQVRRG